MEIHTYGDWTKREPAELTEDGKLLIGWLSGASDDMTPELAKMVREEFQWLAQAHDRMEARINKAIEEITAAQSNPLESLELPTGPSEHYAKGVADGMFRAYMSAMQIVRCAMLEAVDEGKRE